MAPSRTRRDRGRDTESGSEMSSTGSSYSSAYTPSSGYSTRSHSSRIDSFLSSSPGTPSRRRPLSNSSKRSRRTLLASARSKSTGSERSSSQKSILKKKKAKKMKRGSKGVCRIPSSTGCSRSGRSGRRSVRRPMGEFKMVKDQKIKEGVRKFLADYSTQPSDFDAFTVSVDGIPFVAVSLLNAPSELQSKIEKTETADKNPPTPMRRHAPGVNSPRKRRLSSDCLSSSSKCVRFSDENCPMAGGRSRSSSAEEHRELTEKISEALVNNDRKYHDLWHDRVEE